MTEKQLLQKLPKPPIGDYYYRVIKVSPMVTRVDLVHTYPYDYACGKFVSTVWGFIKSGRVYPPKNSKTMRAKSVCKLEEAHTLSGYTSIIPTTNSLIHIL